MNYKIWKCDEDKDCLLIEVFNKYDVGEIQKHFVAIGYVILETEIDAFGSTFMKILKWEDSERIDV